MIVSLAMPELTRQIARYAQHNSAHIEVAGDVVLVPGGEAVKNQHDCVEDMLRALTARHRPTVLHAASAGARCSTLWVCRRNLPSRGPHIRCPTTVLAQDDSG